MAPEIDKSLLCRYFTIQPLKFEDVDHIFPKESQHPNFKCSTQASVEILLQHHFQHNCLGCRHPRWLFCVCSQGINLSPCLALIDPVEQFIGGHLPWISQPSSHWVWESKTTFHSGIQGNHAGCARALYVGILNQVLRKF